MDHAKVTVDGVRVSKRHRQLDVDNVGRLAASMEAIGLQQPITVWLDRKDMPHLVAGLHRLEAARQLGWEEIDATIIELSKDDRTLWEIDENLIRADLTTDEKRSHLRRRKRLWEKRKVTEKPQVGHDDPPEIGDKKPPPQEIGFAQETANQTGMSKRHVNRLLADDTDKEEEVAPVSAEEVTKRQLASLKRAWNKAGGDARRQFLEFIDQPIMDQRFRVIEGGGQ